MPLLDGLDAIDWARLSHAYGPATDVPGLLRALVSSDAAARRRVEVELYGNVIHQNCVWSASSRVVPFFVEILTDGPPDVELRRFCLGYLADLAGPEAGEAFPSRFDPDEVFVDCDDPGTWREQDRSTDREDDELLQQMMRVWGKACYDAVEEALPALLPLLDDADEVLAIGAARVCAAFPRSAERSAPLLRACVTCMTTSPGRGGAALVALALLEPASTQTLAEDLMRSASTRLVALHAACAATIADPRAVSAQARALVAAPVGELGEAPSFQGTISKLQDDCLMLLRCTQ
jgi:hypothetical protein